MSENKNMTGEQIQKILDFFLYQALEALMLRSDIFDDQIAYILTIAANNRKRKVSALEKGELIGTLAACLATDNRKLKFEMFKHCHVERLFVHGFLGKVINDKLNQNYLRMYGQYVSGDFKLKAQLDDIAEVNFGTTRDEAWTILNHLRSFLEKFFEYRTTIMDNYMKMSTVQANSFIKGSPNGTYDFNDLRQSILKATLTALDKYDSSKGALTTYINWWVLNAQTSSAEHEYGIAYTIPQAHKRKIAKTGAADVNFSTSLDALVGEDDFNLHEALTDGVEVAREVEGNFETERMRRLAKSVDIDGLAGLYLDLGEAYTRREKAIMVKQNCK